MGEMHKVFVYGSLKLGFGNNKHFLGDASYLGDGATRSPEYDMVSLGGFPGVIRGENSIAGELYEVDDFGLQGLDRLESNGSLYLREQIDIIDDEGEIQVAWMYLFLSEPWDCGSGLYENVEHQQTEVGFFVQSWFRGDSRKVW